MCGIAGFSLSRGSRVNARQLSNSLLKQIEQRGRHASGFAYSGHKGEGMHKGAVPGGQLALGTMPRNTKTVILHTRFATHGSVEDNRNNHPVLSPSGDIQLTHNGVISNHDSVRRVLSEEIQKNMPPVDTAVIPALIAAQGVSAVAKLSGYAAIAWLNSKEKGVLNLARLETSPVSWTQLLDGSFVYASTPQILSAALKSLNLGHGALFSMAEKSYMKVVNGIIMHNAVTPAMLSDYRAYNQYSSATAGGHRGTYAGRPAATTPATPPRTVTPPRSSSPTGGSESNPTFIAGSGKDVLKFNGKDINVDDYMDDLEEWRKNRGEADQEAARMARQARSMVFGFEDDDDEDDIATATDAQDDGFYIVDHQDNFEWCETLDLLEARLRWMAGISADLSDPFPTAEKEIRWANYVKDIGSFGIDGSTESWIEDISVLTEFTIDDDLGYIREGIGLITSRKGA